MNPLVCPAALAYFLVTALGERYNHIYVFRRRYESAGRLWGTVRALALAVRCVPVDDGEARSLGLPSKSYTSAHVRWSTCHTPLSPPYHRHPTHPPGIQPGDGGPVSGTADAAGRAGPQALRVRAVGRAAAARHGCAARQHAAALPQALVGGGPDLMWRCQHQIAACNDEGLVDDMQPTWHRFANIPNCLSARPCARFPAPPRTPRTVTSLHDAAELDAAEAQDAAGAAAAAVGSASAPPPAAPGAGAAAPEVRHVQHQGTNSKAGAPSAVWDPEGGPAPGAHSSHTPDQAAPPRALAAATAVLAAPQPPGAAVHTGPPSGPQARASLLPPLKVRRGMSRHQHVRVARLPALLSILRTAAQTLCLWPAAESLHDAHRQRVACPAFPSTRPCSLSLGFTLAFCLGATTTTTSRPVVLVLALAPQPRSDAVPPAAGDAGRGAPGETMDDCEWRHAMPGQHVSCTAGPAP